MGYLFLALTIFCESAAIVFMKLSHGFVYKTQAAFAVVFYLCGFIFLTLALKYLPMGWANAIWAGSSTVLVALFGIFYFKEKTSVPQVFFLCLIVVGLVGLQLSGKGK